MHSQTEDPLYWILKSTRNWWSDTKPGVIRFLCVVPEIPGCFSSHPTWQTSPFSSLPPKIRTCCIMFVKHLHSSWFDQTLDLWEYRKEPTFFWTIQTVLFTVQPKVQLRPCTHQPSYWSSVLLDKQKKKNVRRDMKQGWSCSIIYTLVRWTLLYFHAGSTLFPTMLLIWNVFITRWWKYTILAI